MRASDLNAAPGHIVRPSHGSKMIAKKSPGPTDKHVGITRAHAPPNARMSQEKLGDALGLTFQQVQKYEKGTNRIAASRLQHLAQLLQVPVTFFFEGAPQVGKKKVLRCAFASLCDRVSFHGGRPYAGQSVYAHQERETSPRYRASGGRYQPDLAAALRSSQWRHAMRRPLKANKPQPDCWHSAS